MTHSDRGREEHDARRDGRNETSSERSDRNWQDLVQELRVLQTGTQILTAFLLAIAFQPRFEDLDSFGVALYLTVLAASTVAMALGIAPVMLHRTLFGRKMKRVTVRGGDLMLRAAYLFVSLTIIGTATLVFYFVVGPAAAIIACSVTVVILLVLGVVIPMIARRGASEDDDS